MFLNHYLISNIPHNSCIIKYVFLSDSHLDHINDIGFLVDATFEARKETLKVYGQQKTLEDKSWDISRELKEISVLLLKENVISDRAIKNAESIYKSKQKQYLIKQTLPKAWHKLITEPDEILVELLAETTEKLCGYKPDNETVEQFLISFEKETLASQKIKSEVPKPTINQEIFLLKENYTGKIIIAFSFKGKKYLI